jgi:hypothetical protein
MAEVRYEEKKVEYNEMIDAKIVFVRPPITEAEEEKRDAQGEVIKSHKKEIVVRKQEAEPAK